MKIRKEKKYKLKNYHYIFLFFFLCFKLLKKEKDRLKREKLNLIYLKGIKEKASHIRKC